MKIFAISSKTCVGLRKVEVLFSLISGKPKFVFRLYNHSIMVVMKTVLNSNFVF